MAKEFVITKDKLTKYNGEGGHVVIPDTVSVIAAAAFYQNENIVSVEIPGSVKQIEGSQDKGAFSECANLEKVILHEGVEEIGMSTFFNCEKLCEIDVPATITKIGAYAFGNTPFQQEKGEMVIVNDILLRCYRDEVKTVIPDGVKVIGAGAFEQNTTLEEVYIPDSVIRIDKWAFYECKNLRTVKLPKYLCGIGECAFEYTPWIDACPALDIHIPEGIACIEENGFKGISFGERKELIKWENFHRMMGQDIPVRKESDIKGPSISNVVFSSNVKQVGNMAFCGCQIQNLQLNEGLEQIGEYAFCGSKPLTDVILPDSLTEVGENAFARCNDNLIIRSGDKVFAALDKEVRERTILKWLQGKLKCTPSQEKPMIKYVSRTRNAWVKQIKGDQAELLAKILVCGKAKLEQIDAYIEHANDGKHPMMLALLLDYKQKNFAKNEITLAEDQRIGFAERTVKDWEKIYRLKKDENGYVLAKYKGIDKQPEIPAEIEGMPVYAIANNAFKGNESIEEIEIPGTIQTIGDSAFEKCVNLKALRFHEGLQHIGKRAFYHCENLEGELILPEGLLTNGVNAFDFGRNEKLKAIHIPTSVKTFTGSIGFDTYADLYIHGLHTQVDYYLIEYPITIYVHKYSEAGKLLAAYEEAVGGHNGTLKYIDENENPVTVK